MVSGSYNTYISQFISTTLRNDSEEDHIHSKSKVSRRRGRSGPVVIRKGRGRPRSDRLKVNRQGGRLCGRGAWRQPGRKRRQGAEKIDFRHEGEARGENGSVVDLGVGGQLGAVWWVEGPSIHQGKGGAYSGGIIEL